MTNLASWLRPLAVAAPLVFGCSKATPPDARPDARAASSAAAAPSAVAAVAPAAATPKPSAAEPQMLTHLTAAWGRHGMLPPGVGLAVGQVVPDVGAVDETGQLVNLRAAAKSGPGPLVLVFYRGGFCSFANYHLRSLAVQAKLLEETGARFLLISSDSREEAAVTKAAHGLPWPVLADPELMAIRAFKLDHQLTEAEVAEAERYEMVVPHGPAGARPTLSYPAVYVLGEDGKVKFAHADTLQNRMLTVDHIRDAVKKARGGRP